MNVLIVDDETHARNNLRKRLQDIDPSINILGESDSARSARKLIASHDIDLIFLDIEMPEENGFDLLESLSNINFDVIFVTAYNEYALKAFQYHAVGYITKPIDNQMLKSTYLKIKNSKKPTVSEQLLKSLSAEIKNSSMNTKVAIPVESGLEMIDKLNLIMLEIEDGYTALHLLDKKVIYSSKRLKYFEENLDSSKFVRIHRSYMVNVDYIEKYHRIGAITLSNGKEMPVSRKYKSNLANHLKGK